MSSSIIQSIQHLKIANEFMQDFIRSAPGTRGEFIFKDYSRRINWILKDIITYPYFNKEVRDGIKKEIESDAFAVDAIFEKISLLNPDQRIIMEELIEIVLTGKEIDVQIKD